MKKKPKLTTYEHDLEKNFSKSKPSRNQKNLKESLTSAAKKHVTEKRPITIRLLASDIEIMKEKALKMGVPYQTYINILIHREAMKI